MTISPLGDATSAVRTAGRVGGGTTFGRAGVGGSFGPDDGCGILRSTSSSATDAQGLPLISERERSLM